jgi:hypothetical protein
MSAPGQDVPEFDERSRSAYLSRKDVRVLAVVAIVLVLLMMPVYCVLKDQRDEHVCKQNLGHIFKAMGAYIEANDGRFPPAFVVGEKGEPQLFDGAPYTWMSLAHPGLSARASFLCPAAGESETILNLHPEADKPHFRSAYGLYVPWATANSSLVSDPNTAVLVAETSNHGAENTFNPVPFSNGVDGMTVAWDTGNFEVARDSEYVTRLAFPSTRGGDFRKDGPARHGDNIFLLTMGGQLLSLKPNGARLRRLGASGDEIVGHWAVR